MYDLSRVKAEFTEVCENAGVAVNCDIKLNGRLTRTAGRVTSEYDSSLGKYVPTLVEFSKQLVEKATDTSIRNVLMHEAAHYIATTRTGTTHGHDIFFKSICKEIGCTNDGTSTVIENTVADSEVYRYQLYCPTCKKIRGNFHRMCYTLQNIDRCYCTTCFGHVEMIQNW